MESLSIVVVYHPNCKASTDFLIKVSKLTAADIEYINIKDDKIDTDINIDVVPLMIVNNDENSIFKGESAFKKVDELNQLKSTTGGAYNTNVEHKSAYSRTVQFVEESEKKKEKIDLSKK